MVVGEPNINNIMGGIENTGTVRLHNHRKKLKQRFDIIKKLGQGTYGKVQLGINKETGQEVAIKTIKKSKIETEADLVRIRREIQIMSSVQHPNIIHIYEVFENREKMVLVMEYAAGGELYDYLSERKVLTEEEARRIFRQIATACYYCHKHKICHRDLKLENILLDEHGNAKIADFGLSNVFDDQRLLSTFCGSPLYASPEIVKGTPYHGPEVDCWSLGVLLYTLVYGAMPFDGSNFKRLVRQISQGDYFEPKKPSRASPLIREMLTINPRNRANIEKICLHWWVNESYEECCLDISEELANQTPVRLDLLLSLAPPPPQLESEKLVVTGVTPNESNCNTEGPVPTRSQSVGSLMELTNSAQRKIKDLLVDDLKSSPKRKLETTISTDRVSKEDIKRKEKIVKENTVADISVTNTPKATDDDSVHENVQINKSLTQTLSREMDIGEEYIDPSTQGAVCTEIIEDAKKVESNISDKSKDAASNNVPVQDLEEATNGTRQTVDKENIKEIITETKEEKQSKIPSKRKPIKKKVLTDKNENLTVKSEQNDKSETTTTEPVKVKESEKNETEESQPINTKPVERRRSRIFETAEKFQNMISANESKSNVSDKPKKFIIPGVSVGGYKKEFERKASLTSANKIGSIKKSSTEHEEAVEKILPKTPKTESNYVRKNESVETESTIVSPTIEELQAEKERRIQVKNAVDIITNALEKDGTRKSKSRPCMIRKPPVPFGVGGRSASGSIATIPIPISPPPNTSQIPLQGESFMSGVHGSVPAQVLEEYKIESPEEDKTSSAEITLKSATLPRRKTTKAEIQLDYPVPKPATMGFKTEMAHRIENHPKLTSQRSEVVLPVSTSTDNNYRSTSVEPESKVKPKERIIPISFERNLTNERRESVSSPPIKPPITRIFQTQRSSTSQRSNSLSRQSTESDSESNVISGEPIRKSPREYIIPIAVEGGGYVTPRAGSLEPSDTASITSTLTSKSKFNRKKLNEGSEDESSFAGLHKHSSFGRDSDTEDSRKDMFRMHSLRSSRPRRSNLEHNDSFSSGEDDDDDGFEILTAENLFSTLLSRVRDLTQRLNVDGRPGFPSSRLLSSHFDRGGNFWNMHNRLDPLLRYSTMGRSSRDQSVDSSHRNSDTPWRRSVSRDLTSDVDSVFNNTVTTPLQTTSLPRGDANANKENLNLTDLDLKKLKLSDEDALALSYLTPGLSRRIQKQLLAQLAPSEVKKISRTLSMRNTSNNKPECWDNTKSDSEMVDSLSLNSVPRNYQSRSPEGKFEDLKIKSFLPVKFSSQDSDINLRRLKSPSLINEVRSSCSDSSEKLDDSSRLCKYLSPSKCFENVARSFTPVPETKTEYITSANRKPSRFLRPDFYENKDANYFLKEKKEREIETQKVLKEIRDKRRIRIKEQSAELNKFEINGSLPKEKVESDKSVSKSTDNILKNVSDNIKNFESNVKNFHDYVNVSVEDEIPDYVNVNRAEAAVAKKFGASKILRPKSYPTETQEHKKLSSKIPETTTKTKQTKVKKIDKEGEKSKNKFLQSIEKKFEKLRSFSNSPTASVSSDDTKTKEEKKSSVEDTIKRLREQSLPRTVDYCTTESGLIKRAVSVEDLPSSETKQLQTSRKSVGKILNLFKKYEEKCGKSKEKGSKNKKPKDDCKKPKDESKKGKNKSNQLETDKSEKNNKQVGATSTVILNNVNKLKSPTILDKSCNKKLERPNSLLLDNVKYNIQNEGGTSITKENFRKASKLPITSFRRSLNLENAQFECNKKEATTDRSNLMLDVQLLHSPSLHEHGTNRNSYATTDDSSLLLSPYEDNMSCDSWSICSDSQTQELTSPISLCSNFYSIDENESVSDRIRRKSFYTRFNEKKRPRKISLNSYRDMDLYKDTSNRKSNYRNDCNYLDRRSAEPEIIYESLRCKRNRNRNSEDIDDFYQNKYQTYNPRLYMRSASVFASGAEESNASDESSQAGKYKMYSHYNKSSKFSDSSPNSGFGSLESSINSNTVHSPTS